MNYTKSGKFLYTDGHDVDVTDSTLRVKNSFYYLKGINDFGVAIIRPNKIPALIFITLGLVLMIDIFSSYIPDSFFYSLGIPSPYINGFYQFMVAALFIGIGVSLFLIMRRRYALRIETAEGDKKVLVSKNQEYIKQITEAIRRANLNLTSQSKLQQELK